MSYKSLYKHDAEYTKILNEYKAAKNELKRKANQKIYKFETLLQEGTEIFSRLSNNLSKHHKMRVDEITEVVHGLKAKHNDVGYAKRPNEAKEFEMRYKLADDHELAGMTNRLKSNDILELSLLRMELKNREMDQEEQKVKYFIMKNNINGLDEIEQREVDYKSKQLSTYNTIGNKTLVDGDELIPIETINDELWEVAKLTETE